MEDNLNKNESIEDTNESTDIDTNIENSNESQEETNDVFDVEESTYLKDESSNETSETVEKTEEYVRPPYWKLRLDQIIERYKARRKFILISIYVILITAIIITSCILIRYKIRTTISKSHVYVTDNEEELTDFDNYIKEELDISWVPTFLIIKNKTIMGTVKGTINEELFSEDLATCLIHNYEIGTPLPEQFKITNLDGETKSLPEIITTDDLYIIEISWFDCKDCIEQEKYNKAIFAKYNANKFYYYYLKSNRDKVYEYFD